MSNQEKDVQKETKNIRRENLLEKLSQLKKKRKQFLSMTGLTVEEFEELAPTMQEGYEKYMETNMMDGYKRQARKYVEYSNATMAGGELKLFLVTVHLKQQWLQEALGAYFDISQPYANKLIHCYTNSLKIGLEMNNFAPARTREEFDNYLKDHKKEDSTENTPPFFIGMAQEGEYNVRKVRLGNQIITMES